MTEATTSTSPSPPATRHTAAAQTKERNTPADAGAENGSIFGDLLVSLGAETVDSLSSSSAGADDKNNPSDAIAANSTLLDPAWLMQGMQVAQGGAGTGKSAAVARAETAVAAGHVAKTGPVELTPQESDAVLSAVRERAAFGGQARDVGGEVLGAVAQGANTVAGRAHAAMGHGALGSGAPTPQGAVSSVSSFAQRTGTVHSTGQAWAATTGTRQVASTAAHQPAALAATAPIQTVQPSGAADGPFASAVQAMQVVQQFLDPQAAGFERRAVRGQDSGVVDAAINTATGAASHSGLVPEARVEGGNATEQAGFAADAQSADETVAYWASGNTQNAEVTVDRDGQAVQVSVWMNGKDAHITFRSEEAATRAWLQERTEDLQQALEREGIALSGMTVSGDGAQAAQQGGAQGGRSGQESIGATLNTARQVVAQGGEADLAVASPLRRNNASGGNRLDVFA